MLYDACIGSLRIGDGEYDRVRQTRFVWDVRMIEETEWERIGGRVEGEIECKYTQFSLIFLRSLEHGCCGCLDKY